MVVTQQVRRRRSMVAAAVVIPSLVIGGVAGGVLDYRAWHAVAAFEAALPVLLALIVAIGAGVWWLTSRRPLAGLLAIGAIAFVVGFRIGAWIAPSAQRPDWSPGTVTLELREPALGVTSGPASCSSDPDGLFDVGADPAQLLAGTSVRYYLSAGPESGGQPFFELITDPEAGEGPRWDTNVEGDTTFEIRIDGHAASGRAELVAIPRVTDSPAQGGFADVAPDAISGVLTWRCEPPRGELTPIDGSWFR